LKDGQQVVLVGQVTGNTETFRDVIARIEKSAMPVKVIKTMCSDSYSRQQAPVDMAGKTHLVVLVDDGGDGAQSVFEVCSRVNKSVHRIRTKDEIKMEWFEGTSKVAIVGGILVPEWTIADVTQHIRAICPATVPAE
jgi:4-hydroxy-3-methylbut-2-en-1-yl diphosphate reductase